MPDRIVRLAAISLCALLVFLPSCGRKTNNSTSVPTLRYPITANIDSLDPALSFNMENWQVVENIFEGLVGYDTNGKIVPRLAEKWDISDGGRRYTFHLRQDAKFHNGRKVVASDVKYSIERALWPETKSPGAANFFSGIAGVKEVVGGKRKDLTGVRVVDDSTVEILLDKPAGYFLGQLTVCVGCVVCREAIEKNGGRIDENSAVGTGPFKLGQYQPGVKIVLDANRSYYGRQAGVDRVERRIVLDPNTAHLLYETGEADLIDTPGVQSQQDRKDPRLAKEIVIQPTATNLFLVLHTRLQPAFKDLRVRQAFAEAIDRDEAVRLAGGGGVRVRVDTLLAPGIPGYQPGIRRFRYDPAHARQLLASAGFPGGKGFPRLALVIIQKEPVWSGLAQVVRDGLKENLGIEVDLQEREGVVFNRDSNNDKMSFYLYGWTADYLDPQSFLSSLLRSGSSVNHYGYSNPELDALCDRADGETDERKRNALYAKVDEIAMRDVAVLPLTTAINFTLVKPNVYGFEENPICVLPLNGITISPK